MAQIGVWEIDLRTGELSWSEQVFAIHDLPPGRPPSIEEAIGFYAPEARDELRAALDRLRDTGEVMDLELPFVTARGRHLWVRAMGDLERQDGVPVRVFGSFQDITARRAVEEELRQRERRWWLALAGADDGVWDWDLTTNEVYFSPEWKRLLGFEDDELKNYYTEWLARMHPDDLARVTATVRAYLDGTTETYACEHRLLHRDGNWRTFLGRGKVVARAADGSPTRFVGTQTDITEQVRLREELVQAKEAAVAATRAKSAFLATMSHEIRTPLNGVLGLAQVLCDADLSPEAQECARAIHSSGDMLLSLLNDILDLAKIESGKLTIEREPFGLGEVLLQVIDLQQGLAQSKGLTLSLTCASDVPERIVGDCGRIKQIAHNLVGNALKFTERGSVRVEVERRTAPAGHHRATWLRIAVRDTGPGIATVNLRRIFDSFTQADPSTTRRYGGSGLGLAICRELAQLMGGTIHVHSEVGVGSTFSVDLPFGLPEAGAPTVGPETPVAEARPQGATGVRALVVEDNAVNQLVARKMLQSLGCRVDVAGDGGEAIAMAAQFAYDIVFMDCSMPEMDGYEATRRLRRMPTETERRLPVVAMTANVLPEDRARCAAAGMDDFVAKPVRRHDLIRALTAAGLIGSGATARD